MKLRTEIALAIAALVVGIVIVACSDVRKKGPECIEAVPALVPVPLHIGRLGDGGAVIVGFEHMLVVATAASVEFSLSEDIEKLQLKPAGVCYVTLPVSGAQQEYKIYIKSVQEAQ